MPKKIWMTMLCMGLAVFTMALAACGDDDDGGGSEEDKAEIADIGTQLGNTNGAEATQEEIDFYLAHITDEFVQDFGAYQTVAECEAEIAECIGEPLPNATVDPAEGIEIDGNSADVTLATDIGPIGINMTKEDDVWKASGLFVPNDELADGVEVVDLELVEFAFSGDLESDAVKSGDFALHVTNEGEQVHEVVLVALPEEGAIEDLLQDETFEPEPIFVKFGYGPGEESDVALPEPLEAGRYGLVCFLPDTDDEEQTPHAFKGMVAEFTVE